LAIGRDRLRDDSRTVGPRCRVRGRGPRRFLVDLGPGAPGRGGDPEAEVTGFAELGAVWRNADAGAGHQVEAERLVVDDAREPRLDDQVAGEEIGPIHPTT